MRDFYITGAHRSGSSWIGKMIAASGDFLVRDEEIFNWSTEITRSPFTGMYTYICDENEAHFSAYVKKTVGNGYDLLSGLSRVRSLKDVARVAKRKFRAIGRSFNGHRPQIFVEPIGLFSTEWFVETFKSQPIIVIRHPASFVSSLKKLNWGFDFSHITSQKILMDRYLSPFREELENPPRRPDLVGMGILQWKILYGFVHQLKKVHPDWIFVRQEDLALSPASEFKKLFDRLSLPFTEKVRETIETHTSSENPVEFGRGHDDSRRNSAETVKIWKKRLSEKEIGRIRREVEEVARNFYDDNSWS